MKHRLALIAVLSVLSLAVGACGSSSTSSPTNGGAAAGTTATTGTTKFAKTKFVLHAGLAFGAFHHWIYKPAKAGELRHPLQHKLTTLKAALAAGFVYHEVKQALAAARGDPTLSKLVAPLNNLQDKFRGLVDSVKSGGVSPGDVGGLDGLISSIKDGAASAGQHITEQTPSSPAG